MNIGTALITGAQATEPVKPGNRSFDDPAPTAQSVPRLNAFAPYARDDAFSAQPLTMRSGCVGLVAVQLSRSFARPTRQASDCRYCADHWHEHARVMDLCPRNPCHQRQAATIDDEMMFATELAAIGRIWAGILAPEGGKARWQSQYWRAPIQSGRTPAIDEALPHESVAKHLPVASRASGASRSCRCHSQAHAAGIPTECLS